FALRDIPSDEPGLSPMAIWSNESQERYVMAVDSDALGQFETICERERCPYAIVGKTSQERLLQVHDSHFNNDPVRMPLEVLLGKPPKLTIDTSSRGHAGDDFDATGIDLNQAVDLVLTLPAVAAKNFLITIGDRSITGQVVRDQLVGPWQMPVSDVAVTVADYHGYCGEAMAMGERPPIAVLNAAASARMALGESLTNLVAANIGDITAVKLSANWMAASSHPGEDAALFEAVKAVGLELAPALGLAIPVGKDSLSMKTIWRDEQQQCTVTAPVSLIVSAFAPVVDVRKTLTPQLQLDDEATELLLVDLGAGQNRLGGSALAQVHESLGREVPDVDDPSLLKGLFNTIQTLIQSDSILAWHDRSDGGLFVTLAEMAFAANTGIRVDVRTLGGNPVAMLFNEELGGVLQIHSAQKSNVLAEFRRNGLTDHVYELGQVKAQRNLEIWDDQKLLFQRSIAALRTLWWQTSYQMQYRRDNPDCADQELRLIEQTDDPGISPVLSFEPSISPLESSPGLLKSRPPIAILREQGVNGHMEMAAAFHTAGFDVVDVHMSDLVEQRRDLKQFLGLAACGGFSYGDVLGAGGGWANSILFNEQLTEMFAGFFERSDTFALGVCNGCQMLSRLKGLIPGAEHWPHFAKNLSEQFEARVATVEVQESPSVFFKGMVGSRLPVALAHGEGRAVFESDAQARQAKVALAFTDNHGVTTEQYPLNPNGSTMGITGLCNVDGRVTIVMPHPERVFRTVCNSWAPPDWGDKGPWLRMFENARLFVA
ncbi:MAG: phosphoribosylformylglycinamidine synthase, partial [Granulosicoccus sp.]|nr:phosphoribosylformylglycinamidine synthase [Granulosicoccus sp.]